MKAIPIKSNSRHVTLTRLVLLQIIVLCCLSTSLLRGQAYYVNDDSSYLATDFYKQLTTWNWRGKLNIYQNLTNSWYWHINELFQSNLLIPARGREKWKDENTLRGLLFFRQPKLEYGFYLKSWYQNDEQASSDNEFGNQILGLFTTYHSKYNFRVTPYSGIQQSKNRKYIDWGWNVGLKSQIDNFRIGDYNMSSIVNSNWDLYDKRQNFENEFHMGAETDFNRYTSDSISFSLSETKKEYYDNNPLEKKITEVTISERKLRNRLYYTYSPANRFILFTNIQSRKLDFVNDRKIFLIDNRLNFEHYGSKLFYQISLRTNDETQDISTVNKSQISQDNRTRQTIMKLESVYRINENQAINMDLAYSKLQYDTPDEQNTEDRDEQRFVAEIGYDHTISEYLNLQCTLYTYFYHKIYLSSEQSQNNNWNKIYKLNPKLKYQYGRIRNKLDTQVLANYSIYDFEAYFTKTRSFIFRKYTLADSLVYQLYGSVNLGVFTRIELEDKGNYFKNNGTQQLVQSYQSDFFNLFIENTSIFNFNVRIGYTFYKRIEWRHIPEKMKNRTINNTGPFISARYGISKKIIFSIYASYSKLDDSAVHPTNYSTGSLKLNYLF
ncbi:MAG: hypothetical protein P8X42_07425 [Calditrichaceae bacterium]